MQIRIQDLTLTKKHPLTISRGTSTFTEGLLVEIESDGIIGLGEMAPVSIGDEPETAETARAALENWTPKLAPLAPWQMQRIEATLDEMGGGRAARCALDFALYDWLGKKAGLPVYALLGGDLDRIEPTTLTVGINPPEVARERAREHVECGARKLKIKLGSPDGVEADRAMFEAVRQVAAPAIGLRVDANGGWTVDTARPMLAWLAERGVEYVEQPLPKGQEADLPLLYRDAPLPIFADESCRVAADVPRLADRVHGINLKLMKAGGIREGIRVIHTARAHGLQVMMGCMSESSLAIAASAHLSSLADHLDLDSHLNLNPDPCCGLKWADGRVLPCDSPGLGVQFLAK
jgi:L-alanine-DL-glutamate epimerase-like enolase superfamily enzyme